MDCSLPGLCPSPSHKVCPSSSPLYWWCHPDISYSDTLFSFCPQSFPASGTFPESAVHIRWPKYWSFSFSTSPSKEYLGLISLKIGWFDLVAVQGSLRSLLKHHSIQRQQFFSTPPSLWASLVAQMVKNPPAMWETWVWSLGWEDSLKKGMLPIPVFLPAEFHGQESLAGYSPRSSKKSDMTYSLHLFYGSALTTMTTGKTIALTIWTFVGRVMSLLFNTLSRFVIAFLQRSKCLLVSRLQSLSAVIFRAKEEFCHYFHFYPTICHEVMESDVMILGFFVCLFVFNI